MNRYVKIFILVDTAILFFLIGFLYWAHGGPLHESFIGKNDVPASPAGNELKVVSYNIAYGRGLKGDKGGLKDVKTIKSNLDNISNLLSGKGADIALLQEVDFASKRTHHIDEAKYISERAAFPFYACITMWVKNYVPYPYWPPKNQFGKMKSGICVLSKYPILDNIRIPLPQRSDKPFFYTAFYFDRAIQEVKLDVKGSVVTLFNVHLEPFDFANRAEQAGILANMVKDAVGHVIVGGDFNALPPDATVKKDFSDHPEKPWNDVSGDRTMEFFTSIIPTLTEALSSEASEKSSYTFPADRPNRKIDYVFYSKEFEGGHGTVIKETLSDHLPIYAELKL